MADKTIQAAIKSYLKSLSDAYAKGDATEHTYRPALQTLLQAVLPGINVTNEPKQIECGAPDFVLSHNNVPRGYIEAKDLESVANTCTRFISIILPLLDMTDRAVIRKYHVVGFRFARGERRIDGQIQIHELFRK